MKWILLLLLLLNSYNCFSSSYQYGFDGKEYHVDTAFSTGTSDTRIDIGVRTSYIGAGLYGTSIDSVIVKSDLSETEFFDDGSYQSLIMLPYAQSFGNESSYECTDFRNPTLVVTIPGYNGDALLVGAGNGRAGFQSDVYNEVLRRYTNSDDGCSIISNSYVEVWSVDWDSARDNGRQVRKLVDRISAFLEKQSVSWDVVVIGYSRGGIFEHDLVSEINPYLYGNIFLALLDPTAALTWQDDFPRKKSPNIPNNFSSNLYDGEAFLGYGFSAHTVSDKNISNYDVNKAVDYSNSHMTFADDWVDNSGIYGMESFFDYVDSVKFSTPMNGVASKGYSSCFGDDYNLMSPGDTCSLVVRITSPQSLRLDGSFVFSNGGFESSMNVSIGGFQVGYINVMNSEGVEQSISTPVAASSFIISRERASLSYSGFISSVDLSLSSEDGITIDNSILFTGGNFNFNSQEIELDFTAFGNRIDIFRVSGISSWDDGLISMVGDVGESVNEAGSVVNDYITKPIRSIKDSLGL